MLALLAASLLTGCGSPSFENAATTETGRNGASSLSIPVPPSTRGTANGDLLIAILGVKANPNTMGPSGWRALPGFGGFNGATCVADEGGIGCQLAIFYKISDGSETRATFSWGGTLQAAGAVLRYSNVNTSSPIGAAREQHGTSSSPTAPIITTTQDGSRVLRVAISEADNAMIFLRESLVLGSEPASSRFNVVSFPDASTDPTTGCGPPLSSCPYTSDAVALAASDARRSTAGPSGPASWSLAGADQWVTASIEIKPVAEEV